MGITGFAEGLSDGIASGIKLGDAIVSGRNRRGVTEANKALEALEAMSPYDGGGSGGRGAIDAGGGETPTAPTGFSGDRWEAGKQDYMRAMRKVTDPRTLNMLRERLVETEKGKVLDYGNMAISALDSGDYDSAQRYFAGMSFFTDSGTVPNIQVQPDGNLTIESDEGIMAMTRDDISDAVLRLTDYEGWMDLTFDKQKHADTIAHDAAVLAANVVRDTARTGILQQKADSDIAYNRSGIVYRGAQANASNAEAAQAAELHPFKLREAKTDIAYTEASTASVESTQRRNDELHTAKLDDAEKARFTAYREADEAAVDAYLSDPDKLGVGNDSTSDNANVGPGTPGASTGDTAINNADQAARTNASRADELRAQTQMEQQAIRSDLTRNGGKGRRYISLILGALRVSMPDADSAYLANLAIIATVMEDNSQGVLNPATKSIRINKQWYALGDAYFNDLYEMDMEDKAEEQQPTPGPNTGAAVPTG